MPSNKNEDIARPVNLHNTTRYTTSRNYITYVQHIISFLLHNIIHIVLCIFIVHALNKILSKNAIDMCCILKFHG